MNYILFSVLASLWGGSFVAIKSSLESFPPLFSASMRVLTAFVAIYFAFKILKIDCKLPLRKQLLCYLLGLFSISLPFSLLFWGEQFVDAGIAGVINGTVPIWTFLSAYYIFGTEKSSKIANAIAISFSFTGIFLIFSPQLRLGATSNEIFGILAIFGMAISYGLGGNLAKKIMSEEKVGVKAALYHQHISAFVSLLIIAFIFESNEIVALKEVPVKATLAILYLGIFSTGIAYFILFHLLEVWGPIKAMSVTYVIPVMALIFDFIFHGNILLPVQFLGVLIIALGLIGLQRPGITKSIFFRKMTLKKTK